MSIIGTMFIDEFAITRNGLYATAVLTNVPVASLFNIGIEPACGHIDPKPIIPKESQFIAVFTNAKTPDKLKAIRVITIEKVYEYQIIDDSVTLKFSFIDSQYQDTSSAFEVKPIIDTVVRYKDVLAVLFKGGFGDISNSDAKDLIHGMYPVIQHLGETYQFVNAHQYLLSRVEMDSEVVKSKIGIITTYTTSSPVSQYNIDCALKLLLGALKVYV